MAKSTCYVTTDPQYDQMSWQERETDAYREKKQIERVEEISR